MNQQHLNILQNCPLFADVASDDLDAVLNCLQARIIRVSRGQTVFQEGEPAENVGIVLSGWVQMVRGRLFRQPFDYRPCRTFPTVRRGVRLCRYRNACQCRCGRRWRNHAG